MSANANGPFGLTAESPLTVRDHIIIKAIAAGVKESEAIRLGGFGSWAQEHPKQFLKDRPNVAAALASLRDEILFDAAEALRELIRVYAGLLLQEARLEAMLGHDISEIYNVGALKAVQDWPEVWRKQLVVQIESKEESIRSHDGEDTEGKGGWETGGMVRKIKRASQLDIEKQITAVKIAQREQLRLIMRHKTVDAVAAQKQNVDLNITVSAEEQRELAAAKKRARRVIDVTPEQE